MKSLNSIIDFTSWGTILCINKRAEDAVHLQFLGLYSRVRDLARKSNGERENPFDERSMSIVHSDVVNSEFDLPHYLLSCYRIIRKYLE